MPETPQSQARTRAFARVIGPYLVIVPGIIAARASEMNIYVSGFFESPVIVWFAGAFLLFAGLMIIAHHQYWSSAAAVMISLFGWFLTLRGIMLLVAPQLIERGAVGAIDAVPFIRIGFGVLVAIGLWLTFVGWIARPDMEAAHSR